MVIFMYQAILLVGCGPTLTVQANTVNKGFRLKENCISLQRKSFLEQID